MFQRNAFYKQGILLGSDRAILTLCIHLTLLAKKMRVCVYIYRERRESINLEFLIEGFNFWPLLNASVGKLQDKFFEK